MRVWITGTLVLLFGGGAVLSQEPVPVGEEFQVAAYTTASHVGPAVAMDADGNFIVVWFTTGCFWDWADRDIKGQRFDASGVPLGPQFQVNSYTTGRQESPAVALEPDGQVFVVWESYGAFGTDTDGSSIQAQRFDAIGVPIGGQFQVNSYTTNDQGGVAVAADSQGNLVVVWESDGSNSTDTDDSSIQGRRFESVGTPFAYQFQINTYTSGSQWGPAVATDPNGNSVVVWASAGSYGTDTDSSSIQAQRFDAIGVPIGGQFQVNSYTTGRQFGPAAGTDAQGNFIVVWESDGSYGTDTSYRSIQAQRFDADATPVGGQFQVNSYTDYHQGGAKVTVEPPGNFVVVWGSPRSDGTDGFYSIQGQGFDAEGAPAGSQFQVNTFNRGYELENSVAASAQGDFVVVWRSGRCGYPWDESTIQGQRFSTAVFVDGFESGDTSAWTSTVQ